MANRNFVHDGPGKPYYEVYRAEHARASKLNGMNKVPRWKSLKPWQARMWNRIAIELETRAAEEAP